MWQQQALWRSGSLATDKAGRMCLNCFYPFCEEIVQIKKDAPEQDASSEKVKNETDRDKLRKK